MISIIMIVYNVEPYLERAIQSVLNQDYKDFELIITVGLGGTDNCEQICREYASKDSRIKLVFIEPKGPADARNHGLKLVTGDYLGFVDADDYIEPDMFSSMLKNIETTGADIAVCGRFYEFMNKTLQDPEGKPVVYTADEAIAVTLSNNGFFLHCWDKLFTRKITEGLDFTTDFVVEDRIVVDKLISKADKIVYDSTPKYHFRERKGSISKQEGMIRNNVRANEMMEKFLKENHPAVADECNRFMLYEYITAIQNELVSDKCNKEDIREYQSRVQRLIETSMNVSRTIKIKSILALRFPMLLKLYTKRMQSRVKEDLVRFP